ncbi:unnamed protein product [Bursaphelenchus xylophilus]|uniref:(pine wood nematode) hypothetical protein n=1 Tax=Bursaphelenchus xylophilus TaxID=6326 RepID=A0A7I8X6A5_BURXY|nr:unnamed protein product [Bursaphelenchus xylophilus]CAG9122798.1 unnamed protein product [Bursaphelenchus xylophilus]
MATESRMVDIPLCSPTAGAKAELPGVPRLRFRDFKFQQRHICVAISIAAGLLFIGVIVGLVLTRTFGRKYVEDAAFLNQDIHWQHTCEPKCSGKFDVPPLLLISLDGFRVEYLTRQLTPAISKILQCGSNATYMYPTFPSKTFPNHLAIVTGLYPESHGIVGSHFMDFNISQEPFTPRTRNPVWFNGEPIWNTAKKHGKKSATFFWPGSEVYINGGRPTFIVNYNSSIAFSKRVDQVKTVK